ncbi:MAG: glyoxalase, partial [Flavobacteriaceae bacterium CG_4_8_14_3_um_filter_34_10]
DIKFRNALKGMVIGQFTLEEFELYIQNSSALNKRMMHLVIERIKNNIQLLEYEYSH